MCFTLLLKARARKVDLRVSSISPGIVETEFYQTSRFGDEAGAQKFYSQMKSLQVRWIALRHPDHASHWRPACDGRRLPRRPVRAVPSQCMVGNPADVLATPLRRPRTSRKQSCGHCLRQTTWRCGTSDKLVAASFLPRRM